MIQFNLLPDVKLEYVKAQRIKRMVMGSALIATGAAFAIFLLLFTSVHVVQRKNLGDLNDDVKKYSTELKETPDLNKILTIQNQLGALNTLHEQKALSSRSFSLLQQITPSDVTITDFQADFSANTISITGAARGLDRVNVFTDTLKFATYTTAEKQTGKAFSNVVLSSFSRGLAETNYTISASYDPILYDGAHQIGLEIPKTVTTRSVVEQPSVLFKSSETNTNPQVNR